MAANINPSWTDTPTNVVASATLARNAVTSGSIVLATKVGAYLFCRVGRTGTAALTNGVAVRINRSLGTGVVNHPASIAPLGPGFSAVAQATTVNADSAAAQNVLNVASTTSFAVEDYLLIGGGTARQEWARVSRVTDSTHFLLDRALQFTHTAVQADAVRNKADIYAPVWVDGGCTVEVIFDYGDDASGDSVIVECVAQTYDKDVVS